MQVIKQIEHRGFNIQVCVDDCPESPREWDNLGTLYSTDRDINFDNKKIDDIDEKYLNDDGTLNLKKFGDDYIFGFLRCYEHSGYAFHLDRNTQHTNDWDTRYVGIYAVSKDDVIKCYGGKIVTQKKRELAMQVLAGEIDTYGDYANGNVYGWRVNTPEGDSCWGYYGDEGIEAAIEEGKGSIDWYVDNHGKELEQDEYMNLATSFENAAKELRFILTVLDKKYDVDNDFDKHLGRIWELKEIIADTASAIEDSAEKITF